MAAICGAVRIGRGRGLGFHRIQKRLRRRLRWTFVSLRADANDLALHILVTVCMNPFALHVAPTFRGRRRGNNFGGHFGFGLWLLALDVVRSAIGARRRVRIQRNGRGESH